MNTPLFPTLEKFLVENAPPHVAVDNAPENLAQLNQWAQNMPTTNLEHAPGHAQVCGVLLPVWNGASETSIYSSPEINYAYRAYHDWTHLRLQADVDLYDEFRVSCAHIAHARAWGVPQNEIHALWADSHGQNEYYRVNNEFVQDQRAFVLAYMAGGSTALTQKW